MDNSTNSTKNKERLAVWLAPDVISRMDGWLEADNCRNRSEFIGKALRFYMGYISSSDVAEYLSKSLTSTLEGMLADNENRLRSLVFKWCVELNMALHMLAAHFGVPEGNLRALRAYAVDEVKRTNGQIKLDSAVRMQRRSRNDEWQE